MGFADRKDAGRRLAAALTSFKGRHPVILALPRGGVPVAAEIAAALGAPLDLVLVRKVGWTMQPELAVGAVVDGADPIVVRNEALIARMGVSEREFGEVRDAELAEIERRKHRYLGQRRRAPIAGRTVIVVDDGIATGATVKAALRAIRQRGPKELVLAVPVAPAEAVADLEGEVDELVCLETPEPFGAIGYFYSDFSQVSDEEVIAALARFPVETPGDPPRPE
ncbi:phosphoribosyltransferase [Ancylobacter mangrovi]|uniref:phosphoribosyltransferase n=1 Tax=Ancylobacter mangrovi TaxID=2972472 RepID=UPI002161C293|nr:phosphoribosyltransferase family protein [Ancylobacter mangrovi]MCS0503460.1 phosphoribosyltransferase family protein [Ancylobacter mangrovi]